MTATATAPHSTEVEISILGAMLQDAGAAKTATELLRVSDFYRDDHGEIFGAMQSLVARGEAVDVLSVYRELQTRGGKAREIGATCLWDLVEKVSTPANIAQHCRYLREDAARRGLRDLCQRTAGKIESDGADLGALLGEHREALNTILPPGDGRPFLVRAGEMTAEAVTFAVHSLVPAGMLTLLSGKDKRGKTLMAQEIVRATLRGTAFLDRFPTRGGPAVGAFLDDPTALTLERLEALGVRTHPDLHLVHPAAFDGDAVTFLDRLKAEAAKERPALVVVDSFYQLVPPGRESGNDQARMGPLMGRLNSLATETGAAVLVVAHDNKSGLDVAGSHVIRAAAKCIMRLTLPRGAETDEEDGPPTTPRRILTVESKFGAATSWAVEIRGVGDWRCYGSPRDLRASDTLQGVRAFLAGGKTGTADEIAKAINRRREDVEVALSNLCQASEATSETRKPKGRGRPAVVFRAAELPSEYPSQGEFPSQGRDGNSDAQVLDFPSVTDTEEFPSGPIFPRGENRDGNSSPDKNGVRAEVEV